MNSLIYHVALLIEAVFNRLIRVPFARIFAVLAVAAPLALLAYATVRYSDAVARATVVVLGSERIVLGLIAVLVARSLIGLAIDVASRRLYGTEVDAHGTLV